MKVIKILIIIQFIMKISISFKSLCFAIVISLLSSNMSLAGSNISALSQIGVVEETDKNDKVKNLSKQLSSFVMEYRDIIEKSLTSNIPTKLVSEFLADMPKMPGFGTSEAKELMANTIKIYISKYWQDDFERAICQLLNDMEETKLNFAWSIYGNKDNSKLIQKYFKGEANAIEEIRYRVERVAKGKKIKNKTKVKYTQEYKDKVAFFYEKIVESKVYDYALDGYKDNEDVKKLLGNRDEMLNIIASELHDTKITIAELDNVLSIFAEIESNNVFESDEFDIIEDYMLVEENLDKAFEEAVKEYLAKMIRETL